MPENSSGVPAETLLAALPDTVVVADAHGMVAYVSPAVRTLLGYDPTDLIGRPLQVLMPERLRRGHGDGFSRFRATGEGKLVGATTQVPALHAAGHEVAVDLTLSRLAATPGTTSEDAFVVGVLRDASTTILLERQFEVSRYLAATMRVTAALTEAPDADVAFERLLPNLCAELDWDCATLWQPDEADRRLTFAGIWAVPGVDVAVLHAAKEPLTFARGQGLPGLTWHRQAPVVIEDLDSAPPGLGASAARSAGFRTGVAFPVVRGATLLGVCELFTRQSRPVPPELLEVLAHAGRQIGQFLGRLRAESDVRELADTLQRSLLPSHLPTIPGVQLAARYRPGGDTALVGGDTYDVMPLPDGRWMVLIADVCGTGAEAAAVTAVTRHTARAAAVSGGPAGILAAVNAALLREQGQGPLRFVTACCLVLEPTTDGHRVHLSVAGHPLPVLRGVTGEARETGTVGRPLGIEPDVTFEESVLDLPAGSTLVLYTDGVTEARDDAGRQFGEDALLRVVTGAPTDAEATVGAVTAAVEQQLAGSRYEPDDLAVLALTVPR